MLFNLARYVELESRIEAITEGTTKNRRIWYGRLQSSCTTGVGGTESLRSECRECGRFEDGDGLDWTGLDWSESNHGRQQLSSRAINQSVNQAIFNSVPGRHVHVEWSERE